MDHFDSTALVWAFALLQVLGILTAWFARVTEGSCMQAFCQRVFLLTLLVIGIATMWAWGAGGGYWLLSSATLGLMTLAAVCDFEHNNRAFTM